MISKNLLSLEIPSCTKRLGFRFNVRRTGVSRTRYREDKDSKKPIACLYSLCLRHNPETAFSVTWAVRPLRPRLPCQLTLGSDGGAEAGVEVGVWGCGGAFDHRLRALLPPPGSPWLVANTIGEMTQQLRAPFCSGKKKEKKKNSVETALRFCLHLLFPCSF